MTADGVPGGEGDARAGTGRARVRHNDWRAVAVAPASDFVAERGVSVVVPHFENPDALASALAALERQTYPRALFEVVVVDDGSRPPAAVPASTAMDVRVVRHGGAPGGAGAARDRGARAARHGILVFLDCDMVAAEGLVEAHARWHHALPDALTVGTYARVAWRGLDAERVRRHRGPVAGMFADRAVERPWVERHFARTRDLTSRHDDLFRAVSGGNFGMSRTFYEAVGGFDPAFGTGCFEDLELAYRACTQGAVLVPVRAAHAWHCGTWDERARRRRAGWEDRGRVADRVAHPDFRPAAPGRMYAVPTFVVTVDARDAAAQAAADVVERLLGDDESDLAVRLAAPATGGAGLRARFAADARVHVDPVRAAEDAFPASPYFVTLPVAALPRGVLAALRRGLGPAAAATVRLADGSRGSVARAWAVHRARRHGGAAADYGEGTTVVLGRAAGRRRSRPRTRADEGHRRRLLRRVLREAGHVRGRRTAAAFLGWLALGLRWWLGARVRRDTPPRPAERARADPGAGGVALLGPRAQAVLPATTGAAAGRAGVVLADTRELARGAGRPAAVLDEHPELAVPAFDPARWNPIGWVRRVERRTGALGPPCLLPSAAGVRRIGEATPGSVRHFHHLEDVAGFHAGAEARAGVLARIAATGVPVHVADAAPALETLLGGELHGLMASPLRGLDAEAREALSVRMRRAALRRHAHAARVGQIAARALSCPPRRPGVAIVLATRRPELLAHALANVARQTYPALELVLALHGPGFAEAAVRRGLARLGIPSTVLRVGADCGLGAVLDAATAMAGAPLVAKMDDDDLYGADHVWDLVLAQEYSGADVVGKAAETFYLHGPDLTVCRRRPAAETYDGHVAGASILATRAALDGVGGWPPAPGEDVELARRVRRAGGRVYRTHGRGLLVSRRVDGHSWFLDEARLLRRATAVAAGFRPALADIVAEPPDA